MSSISQLCFVSLQPLSCRGWRRFRTSLLLVACLGSLGVTSALGQTCPEPWASAPYAYGVVILSGNGASTSGTITQHVNQNAAVGAKMAQPLLGSCAFMAIPLEGFGQTKSTANVSDSLSDSSSGNSFTWVGSGPGNYSGAQTTLSIDLLSPQYSFGAWDAVSGTYTVTDSSGNKATTEEVIWGAANSNGGASLQQLPLPAGAAVVWGSTTYSSPPFDSAQGGLLNAPWQLDWLFSPAPDDDCEPCKRNDKPLKGSELSPRSQALGEDVDVVGTPFFLHYESSRTPGHAGADMVAIKDARALGGWTLNVHHVFEPLLQNYCAGGSCTAYATIPKAVFLGDGNTRKDADVQAGVSLNGNSYVTSEDGAYVYVFNPGGLHLQTLRALTGAVVYKFAYDAQNRLTSVTDVNGNVTSIQRAANGSPTGITSPFGQQTKLAVDTNGFLSQITDPAGHATKLVNSTQGLLSSLTDPNGKVYTLLYDNLGRLTKHADPAGGSVTLARTDTATGYSVKNTTALGRASTYQVAFSSTASQTSQATTNTWQNGLHATETDSQQNGKLSESATMPNGTSYSRTLGPDPRWGIQVPILTSEALTRGNLIQTITGSRTASLSNPANPFSLTTQTDTATINGRAYSSMFTAATKTRVDKTPMGRTTTTVLDAQERISTVQPAGLALSRYTYDTHGRLSSLVEGTRSTTFTYDANGNMAGVTNPLGLTVSFTRDATGQLLTSTLADGRIIHYTYDANGNLKSVTPPAGSVHNFTYSTVNLATAYTPPVLAGAGATTYAFNADRDLTKITRPDGEIITYNYDTGERLTSIVTPTSTINYAYNATTGNLASASVSGGEAIAYAYNGPLPIRSTWTGTVAGYVSRVYNNNFWVTSQGINGANNIAFTYDKDGLLTQAGALTQVHNAQTGLYTGGTLASATDAIVHSTLAEPTSYTAKYGTTVLYSATYTRDQIGRITTLTEAIGGATTTYAYTFDKAGRLTTVKKGTTTAGTYTYDTRSNRLTAITPSGTVTGTYDAQDRLLTYGTASYTYTGNGERATKTVGTQTTTYQYDVLGNLMAVTLPTGTAISYIIDAENNRVAKKVNGVVAEGFLYDAGRLVAQLNVNNQIVSQFVYGSRGGSPEYMVKSGVNYRIFSDHLGSPRLVVNSVTGAIVERIDYDEFGNVVNDTNGGFQPFGYAGGLYDQDTKLVRFGARDYDASSGRWTAKDPIRFDGGDTNLYGYVLNDPVNLIDPTGLEGTCPCKKPDAPTRDKDLETMTQEGADRAARQTETVKPTVPTVAPPTVLDRLGVTHSGPPEQTPSPLSLQRGGMTATPNGIEGGYRSTGNTQGTIKFGYSVSPNLARTTDIGNWHLKAPFPLKEYFQLLCQGTW